jgi:hypothetical protein
MPIAVTCPKCSRRHQAPDSLAGTQARCACGAVLAVPALASATATTATMAAAPKRPSGSWGSSTPATPPAPTGPSVFDDISPADVTRHKPQAVVQKAVAPTTDAAMSPVAGNTSQYLERARTQIQEHQQEEAAKLPYTTSMALACLAIPGVLALGAAFVALMALGGESVEDLGSLFIIGIFVVCSLQAILNIGTAVLIYLRAPYSRLLGYFTGVVTLCTSCVNPVGFICSIIALWFLAQKDTGDYLARKGNLGIIDW